MKKNQKHYFKTYKKFINKQFKTQFGQMKLRKDSFNSYEKTS